MKDEDSRRLVPGKNKEKDRMTKKMIDVGEPLKTGQRTKGMWEDYIEDCGKETRKTVEELKSLVRDRKMWTNWIEEKQEPHSYT